MLSSLDRKLFRDLSAIKGQVLAVGLVMACGLAMMILSRSLIFSLTTCRDRYYQSNRMAHVFADLRRAPKATGERIRALPGVTEVETRVKGAVLLDLPGVIEPSDGLIVSLPEERQPRLMQPYLRVGRTPEPGRRGEVLVSEAFASARNLRPGETLSATIRGKRETLTVTGIALSPEFVFEARAGETLPDPQRFGIFWMPERELSTALELEGAFNNVCVSIGPDANTAEIERLLDSVLAPYGGLGAFGLAEHPSARRLTDELQVLAALAVVFPIAFLSVAAFMSSAVLTRLVRMQREQIAQLKAFGYSTFEVGVHYAKFALCMVMLGGALGTVGGLVLGSKFVHLYHRFFKFPSLDFLPDWNAVGVAFLVSAIGAFAGALGAVLHAMRLPPAQAMRPEPPASFQASLVERMGLQKHLSLPVRIALRNLERRPWQAAFTALGLALASGIPILPGAMRDGVDHVLSFDWDVAQRQNASVSLREPGSAQSSSDLAHLPGVLKSEPFRTVPVRIRFGNASRRLALTGLTTQGNLSRPLDSTGKPVSVPPSGLVASAKLAELLHAKPGDTLKVEVLDGKRPSFEIKLHDLVTDYAGLSSYIDEFELQRLLKEGHSLSGSHMSIDTSQWAAFFEKVKNTPAISALRLKEATRLSFRKTTAESINLLQVLYFSFAVVVSFGVVYNSARISLSERTRDLATLRILGFTGGEVAAILLGELLLLTLLALPSGMLLGSGLTAIIIGSVNTESVRLPLVLTSQTFTTAAAIVITSTGISFTLIYRRIRELDLLAVLKAAE